MEALRGSFVKAASHFFGRNSGLHALSEVIRTTLEHLRRKIVLSSFGKEYGLLDCRQSDKNAMTVIQEGRIKTLSQVVSD
jgi:hypothetical protein